MPPVYSFSWLCNAMQTRQQITLTDCLGVRITGRVNGIEVEDGSGRHFLVRITGYQDRIYVRAE